MAKDYPQLEELVAFHGHLCPGLAIGYRAARAALDYLDVERPEDEELVAIVENDSCSVDAFQFLAGTTFGKGNLIFRDWGKQVFTLAPRDRETAVRVALRGDVLDRRAGQKKGQEQKEKETEDSRRQKKVEYILDTPTAELFEVREVETDLPPPASIHKSVKCCRCGEPVMETRTVSRGDTLYCRDCARLNEE